MPAYLFELELPLITEEIAAIIPAHREHISVLLVEGKIISYSVSQTRNMIWCVLDADSEQEAMESILLFPLYPHFTDIVCHPLLFHSNLPVSFPGVSLN